MSAKSRRLCFDLGLIFILGLAPLLWFEPGSLIKGIDFDLPLTMERLKNNFFYMWDYQSGAGLPRHLHFPAILFFLPQALFHSLGFSLEMVQRIFFCLWFTLPGIAFYYLMRGVTPGDDKASRAGVLAAVSFYMFNLYLEPVWLGLNIANLSAYVAVPFALGVLIRALEKETQVFLTALKFGLVFAAFPSIAVNPSIVLISSVPFVLLIAIHLWRWRFAAASLFYLAKLLPLSFLLILVFNAYWILPEAINLFQAQATFEAASRGGGNIAEEVYYSTEWLRGVSRNTSLPNVLKMQGDWPWYEGFREHAKVFWNNPLWIVLAWFPCAMAFLTLWRIRHPYKWFFATLWGIGIFFSMGSHMPFGVIYVWMVKHVPLFWTIRSPWYKFTLLTCLGYGVLIGMGARWLLGRVHAWSWRWLAAPVYTILLALLVAASPVYAFPLIQGKMFRKSTPENSYSNHFKIPPHVLDAADWLNQNVQDARVWDLPARGISYNKWGYESFLPLIGYFLHAPLLCDNHPLHIPYQGAWSSSWMPLSKMIRNAIEKGLTPYVSNLMRLLQIKYVLQEGDFRYEVLPFPVTRKEINEKLESLAGVRYVKQFTDAWDLWEVDGVYPSVYFAPKISVVNESIDALVPLSPHIESQKAPAYLFLSDIGIKLLRFFYEKDLIQEVVQFEDTFLDWVIQSMEGRYLHRFVNDPEKGLRQEINRQIDISETGDYLILAKKKVPIRETPIRVPVDFTTIPQTYRFYWNQEERYPLWDWTEEEVSSLKQLAARKLSAAAVFYMMGMPFGFYFDAKPIFYLADWYWHVGSAKRKRNPLVKMFKMNGELSFRPDPEIVQIWKKNPSENWQYLGSRHLTQGKVEISACATIRHRSQWDFFVVPKEHFIEAYEFAHQIFSSPSIDQLHLFASSSSWNNEGKIEQKKYRIGKQYPFTIAADPVKKRGLFPYEVADKLYSCYQGNQLFLWVENPTTKKIATNLTFEILLFQKKPGTVIVQLNNEVVQEIIAEPMEEVRIYAENVTLLPGKNKLVIASWSEVNALGELLGNEETKRACFGYRDLAFGELYYQQPFYLPAGRDFEIYLFPFFGKKQNKTMWKEAVLTSQIKVDGQSHFLEKVHSGTEKVYLRVEKPLRLEAGEHELEFSKAGDEEYFVMLKSSPERSFVSNSPAPEWTRPSATRVDLQMNLDTPCFLIFSDAFDPKWQARAEGQLLQPHFKVNGFANAFYVEGKGTHEIEIEFTPQKHFQAGLAATGGGFLLVLLYFVFSIVPSRKRKT